VSFVVLVTDNGNPDLSVEDRVFGSIGAKLLLARTGDEAELVELAPQADAILTNWRPVTGAVLNAAVKCRVVGRYGVGLDNIDVEHATRLGIAVTNTPGYCTDEVADHTILMLLALARKFAPLSADLRAGGWDHRAGGLPVRLRGKRLGLVGLGAIGRAVAPRARALGLDVVAFRRTPADVPGVRITGNLAELLSTSDFVSLHLPLTEATHVLIGEAELATMKEGSYLINTARGGLVDHTALLHALAQGRLAGAALDVTEPEPLPVGHPLRGHPAVIVTPHSAFYSDGAVTEVAERAARGIVRALRGEIPDDLVNPEILASPALRLAR
jgi:D-3-phosphoglycerate dehydrogenase